MRLFLPLLMLGVGSAAAAQTPEPAATVIAIPPLTSPDSGARGNEMLALGWQVTQLIETDLRQTAEVMPLQPNRDDYYSYPEVTAPSFPKWRATGAKALVTGFVQSRSDGRLTVGCYVYDTQKGRELGRKGFIVGANDWRRAAHKCSGLAYTAITGAPGMFDTQIAYVAESGVGDGRTRRIALMDSDGYNHRYLTQGTAMVLTPDIAPKGQQVAFVSFADGRPTVRIADAATGAERPLMTTTDAISFAPRFSPDGSRIAFSMMNGPNADIYVVGAGGGAAQRLTTAPGVDTSPSFSPDGSQIVFESDRGGSQQLYVMNADGSGQRRISFGGGWYAAPEWSPDGAWIAFTRRAQGGRSIGIMKPDGQGERMLTSGPADEGASWAASSRELVFQRGVSGRSGLARIALDGSQPRAMTIPQDGSDPAWSRVIDQ